MWTLIVVTLVVSGASIGGVSTTTSFLDFQDEAKCRTAADAVAEAGQVRIGEVGSHPNSLHRRFIASLLNALRADNIRILP